MDDPTREPDDGLDVSDLSLDGTGDGTSDGSLPVAGDPKIIKLVRKYKGKFKLNLTECYGTQWLTGPGSCG